MESSCLAFSASVSSTSSLARSSQHRASRPSRVPLVIQDVVRLRFSRFGRKKRPFYRIVAVDKRKPREGRPLEYVGWHDPLKDETNLNAPAIKKWLANGAQPSDTVRALLKKAMVIEE